MSYQSKNTRRGAIQCCNLSLFLFINMSVKNVLEGHVTYRKAKCPTATTVCFTKFRKNFKDFYTYEYFIHTLHNIGTNTRSVYALPVKYSLNICNRSSIASCGSGSGSAWIRNFCLDPDPDPAKSERAYK